MARTAAADAIRLSRQSGRASVRTAKDTAAAGVTAAEATVAKLRGSSLAPRDVRSLEQRGADILRAGALGPQSIWGSLSLLRLLQSPAGSDLLEYAAYSDNLTQKVVQVMLGQMPDRAASFVVRDLLSALTPPVPSH